MGSSTRRPPVPQIVHVLERGDLRKVVTHLGDHFVDVATINHRLQSAFPGATIAVPTARIETLEWNAEELGEPLV